MALHTAKNKTAEMLCLPGDGITDVFSRVWGHQGSNSEQIHGHVKKPDPFSLSFPLCLLHLKTSFSIVAK